MILTPLSKKIAIAVVVLVVLGAVGGLTYYFLSKPYKGAVATNAEVCAQIGGNVLNKGGNAVDAAIASLFCEGVAMPAAMGLGGGFLMTIYNSTSKTAISLNSREVAPGYATEDMYNGDPDLAARGILSVAVPGELRGYWWAHQRYGSLPWADLIQPTIDLCKNGIPVTSYLENLFKITAHHFYNDPGLREIFIKKETNSTYVKGDYIKRLNLANTLEIIAREGGDTLYNGTLSKIFIEEFQSINGNLTYKDMEDYTPEWQEPLEINLSNGQKLFTTPLPGSGIILSLILNVLNGFLDLQNPQSVTNYQRIVESFKFGYGRRTDLGDPNFVEQMEKLVKDLVSNEYAEHIRGNISDNFTSSDPAYYGANTTLKEDHGTCHISVLAPNGDAVSVTSTVNLYFGAAIMLPKTGIILNDQMDDFSSPNISNSFGMPPSYNNYIKPGKRPVSSMCPSIIVDGEGTVRLITGGAGGTKITTAVALTIIRHLWYGENIKTAVDDIRFHHQLFPMKLQVEPEFLENTELVQALTNIGHAVNTTEDAGFAAITSISYSSDDGPTGTYDKRRSGSISYV